MLVNGSRNIFIFLLNEILEVFQELGFDLNGQSGFLQEKGGNHALELKWEETHQKFTEFDHLELNVFLGFRREFLLFNGMVQRESRELEFGDRHNKIILGIDGFKSCEFAFESAL